jgi:hypothetical protein
LHFSIRSDRRRTSALAAALQIFQKKVAPVSKLDSEITLAGILELEELRDDCNIIMKMDIEGDEWAILDATSEYSIAPPPIRDRVSRYT